MALQAQHPDQAWNQWPQPLAEREPLALAQARLALAGDCLVWQFCQWVFFRQWRAFKAYANAQGVRIVGDIPIFIAHQSADVWARPDLFELDGAGSPTVVAGVPPDGFSATGQRWGNPLYRWPAHGAEHYRWWIARIRNTCALVDLVRLDHFRGFESYWEIPASAPTAEQGRWVAAPGDALLLAATQALAQKLAAEFPVRYLVNNAGANRPAALEDATIDDMQYVTAVTLGAAMVLTQAFVPGMRAAKFGRIVNIGSINGQAGQYGQVNYAAAKSGIHGFTKALAQEVASRNVTCNVVAPGYVETAMTDVLGEPVKAKMVERIPTGRIGRPEDIAAAVVYLASPEAGWVTGQTLHVNGGMAMY
jgi:NAD(P)-dependent dehydrogenase (short-subunit alcohol dehydrogenase family)